MGLSDALKQAAEKAEADYQKLVQERLIEYHADVFGYAQKYDNAVILAGYGAFFALWVGVGKDITASARLVTVALIGTSLICYMTWHILQMLTRQKFEFQRADSFTLAENPQAFNQKWTEIEIAQGVAQIRIMRLWPWLFVPSVALGFAGGAVLTWSAAMAGLGWPLQLR